MYQQIRSQIKTGDIIGFSGKGLFSNVIKAGTLSKISHVGLVLGNSFDGIRDSVLIIESTTLSKRKDLLAGDSRRGVQIHMLSEYVNGGYNGDIYWFPLKKSLNKEQKERMTKWLLEIHREKISYDEKQVIKAGLDIFDKWLPFFKNKDDLRKLFCSELVEKALQLAYGGKYKRVPSEQTPKDVIETYTKGEGIKLIY